MLDTLLRIEKALPKLIENRAAWHSLDVDYEPPRVERVWRDTEDEMGDTVRICLHRIHPCERALVHPHPWPSAMRVVHGRYEMKVGDGGVDDLAGTQGYHKCATLILHPGSAYEMVDPHAWHSVRPLGRCAYSLMIMGPKYKEQIFNHKPFGQGRDLKSLPVENEDEILRFFAAADVLIKSFNPEG